MNREHGLQKDLQTAKVALINVFKIMIYQTAEKFSAVFFIPILQLKLLPGS